jgi:hypothetical protein
MKSNCTGKHFLALLDSIEHLLPELPPEQKQQKQKLRADVLDWIKKSCACTCEITNYLV